LELGRVSSEPDIPFCKNSKVGRKDMGKANKGEEEFEGQGKSGEGGMGCGVKRKEGEDGQGKKGQGEGGKI
jgi:hypothetical protein